jgi:hypothetical protein
MLIRKRFQLFITFIFLTHVLKADMAGPAYQYDKYSENERYYFKSIPFYNFEDTDFGKTVVYDKATNKMQYKIDNYLSRGSFINNNGQTLITTRYWVWGHDYTKFKDEVVITIFIKGKKVREYKVDDLIKDRTQLTMSSSHTMWFKYIFIHNDIFYVYTLDNQVLLINSYSGEIIAKKKPSELSSQFDFEHYEKLPKLRDTVYTNIKYPKKYEFPKLANNKDFRQALLTGLNKKETKDFDNSNYYINLSAVIDKNGKCEIFSLRGSKSKSEEEDEIWKKKVADWVTKQKYLTNLIPKNCDKWVFEAYFYIL